MKFDELDSEMRIFETAHDVCVLPGIFMVARIDGRGFTRLTKEVHAFEEPFDPVFRDHMVNTVKHLMNCGFRTLYGYTQSDEMSILLHPRDQTFGRKERKIISILAGEASACFTRLLGDLGCFDCRVCQLPSVKNVVDYFRWRNEDAHRNALNGHCYWALRKSGLEAKEATKRMLKLSVAQKNELLIQHGTNFNDLPLWQKRGIGVEWEEFEQVGRNPLTGEEVACTRRKLRTNLELPMKDDYSKYICSLVDSVERE